ncbi:EamA/RhaT family transporter [Flavobacterium sufflavum]|uniref:EamA/RhaT family transporter n=1 Tax=Flavobacterium sufflavum TaxID=1921138 RepID=A0A3S2UK38_9FLAO|nr:EamA family transporter [Flavobacterium sufflavum]RVT71713.1 EamA/RhaT family transporter [Flavobacterium sufflavum]
MLYLLLSIVCSVSVGVIFKIARKWSANAKQIVLFNYIFALLLCYVVFSPDVKNISAETPFSLYLSLGILLPVVFLFLIASIKSIGIVKTDAAQRLSLFVSIVAAWLLFKEVFSITKLIGIAIGFSALFCVLNKTADTTKSDLKYPVLVFLGFGIIDILFKKVAAFTAVPYTTSLFVIFSIAFFFMFCVVLYEMIVEKKSFAVNNLFLGFLVGCFNFGNILFYLKAHQVFSTNPSTVFAGMNMGVILLGSIVGVVVFKEKLSKLNYTGLVLALLSILFIVLSI